MNRSKLMRMFRELLTETALEKGVPDKYIMQRGGWTTDSTLKNIYQHTMADKQKEFDDVALKHFDSIIE